MYRLIVPPSIRRQIEGLSPQAQRDVRALLDDVRADPGRHTGAYGMDDEGPIRMRSAGRGGILIVVLINDLTINVTLMSVQRPLDD